jgi:hypothetical protein
MITEVIVTDRVDNSDRNELHSSLKGEMYEQSQSERRKKSKEIGSEIQRLQIEKGIGFCIFCVLEEHELLFSRKFS